jgi:hypothetical protein
MSDPCMRDDGRCRRCSHGCYVIVPCNRCGDDFRLSDMDDGLCPDCAEVVAERRAADRQDADDRAAEEAEDRRLEALEDERNRKD